MKKMINFLTLLILIIILSIITIFITSCNSSSDNNIIGSIGGSGGSGGSGGGNVITLSLNNTGTPGTPVSQANNVNNNAVSEVANGLLDPNTNTLFILGNDFPQGNNPNFNVYLFQFDPANNNFPNNPNNPLTIDFTSGTDRQGGNLYIDQDNTHIYVMGSHNNGTDSDIFVAKIKKSDLTFENSFGSGSPIQGLVLLDRGNNESTGGLLVDGTNLYVAGYNNQGNVIIFKLDTSNGSTVNAFGSNGYATINVDNNNNTIDIATDILTDGTNLIIVGEQINNTTTVTNLILFKVDPNTGNPINNSLITINPPSGESLVAAALDAVILNNKVYLGATLQPSNKSVLAVFDLNNNNGSYFTFKDNNNNDIKIFITDVYYPGTGNIIYLSGIDTTNNNNNAAFIKFDTSNNNGSYLIANSTAGMWWGNILYNNNLYIFGRVGSSAPTNFTVLPINNP
jgi:hypothetical protein